MSAGLPVVATRVSGSREAIVDASTAICGTRRPRGPGRGHFGVTPPPGGPAALGDAARRTVVAQYSLEAMLHRLEELYWTSGAGAIPDNAAGGRRKAHVTRIGSLHACYTPKKSLSILHTEASLGWAEQERRILVEALACGSAAIGQLLVCDPRGELCRRARLQNFR